MFKLFGNKKQASARLDNILQGAKAPSFKAGLMKLLKLMRDPDSDIREITEALNWDPGLVVRLLGTVNSAAFGLRREVTSVQHAATILGHSKLEQLVLTIAVKESLPTGRVEGFDPNRYWNSAFFRASLARAIAERLHPAEQASSFTAGLLQDMAIPLLAHAREDYRPILAEWHGTKDVNLQELEQRELGWTHEEAGALLGNEWSLPESLVQSIHGHHHRDKSDFELQPALRLVALHRETEQEFGLEAIVEEARGAYGLDTDWLLDSIESSHEQANELSKTM